MLIVTKRWPHDFDDHTLELQLALDQLIPDQEAPDQEAPDQEALDHEALDQEAHDHEAPDHEAPDQLAPDHEAPDQLAPDHEAPFQSPPDQLAVRAAAFDQVSLSNGFPKMSSSPCSTTSSSIRCADPLASSKGPFPDMRSNFWRARWVDVVRAVPRSSVPAPWQRLEEYLSGRADSTINALT